MAPPTPSDSRQRIVEIIGNSIYHVLGLKESLEDERKALAVRDIDALNAAIENKSRCVASLHTLEQERRRLCSLSDHGEGTDHMQQMAAWCEADSVIASSWDQLMAIVAECNTLNMTNGAIIRVRKDQIESSLSVLRGGTPGTDMYSRDGTGSGSTSQRSLAEA
jgi:flagella synthesis protein FlgN